VKAHDAIRFVIFAAPRTGSNLLCSLLNAHPDIVCHHGMFNPDGIHCARDRLERRGIFRSVGERDRDPAAFLDAVWASADTERAIGFKMNRGENDSAVDILLRDTRVRKILLKRRNRVRTYVSEEIARRTGVWESYDESANAPIPSIHVDPDKLIQHIGLNAAYYAKLENTLRETGQERLETHYEALADRKEIERIFAFLGVGACSQLHAACRKRASLDLVEVIGNVSALADALHGTVLLDELYLPDVSDLHSLPISLEKRAGA
jgi:LPS sulfotransferase NodH